MNDTQMRDSGSHLILIRDSQVGWEVLILPRPTRDGQDGWFLDLSEARQYAAGLNAATGWVIADEATCTGERAAARKAAEQPPGGLLERLGEAAYKGRWGKLRHRF